jgi:hypothetical protein
VKDLQLKLSKLHRENEELKGELNCFDPAFFDEIEDLKYNHNEMVRPQKEGGGGGGAGGRELGYWISISNALRHTLRPRSTAMCVTLAKTLAERVRRAVAWSASMLMVQCVCVCV